MEKRETFSSRLGFILVSAGCAVGIGNVWKFPYICGQFGGAAFILIYLPFWCANMPWGAAAAKAAGPPSGRWSQREASSIATVALPWQEMCCS